MKLLLLLFFGLTGYSYLSAQDSTIATIKTGERPTDVLSASEIYYYPEFITGKVFFRDGTRSVAKMNYNRLFDQMLFIDQKGDTLAVADEGTIKLISIEKDTFYYDEGYLRQIVDKGVVKLAERQVWVMGDVRKIGSHDRPATTYAVTSVSTLSASDRAKSHDLLINENIIIKKETLYFFGDEYNQFVPASKKKLLLLFPKEHLRLENYLKENEVHFNKKEDLEKLTQFISKRNK